MDGYPKKIIEGARHVGLDSYDLLIEVLFRTRRRDECLRLKEGVRRRVGKAVRRKPRARRTRDGL
jgi:hypothetical protein